MRFKTCIKTFLFHLIKNKLIQEELEALHKTLHEQQCQFSRYQEEFFQS